MLSHLILEAAHELSWSLTRPLLDIKALERFCDLGTDSRIPLIIKSRKSLIFSRYPGVLLSHWGSWLGNLASAAGTLLLYRSWLFPPLRRKGGGKAEAWGGSAGAGFGA
jgi:hypothetical protein